MMRIGAIVAIGSLAWLGGGGRAVAVSSTSEVRHDAQAAPDLRQAHFALIIGSNLSVDGDLEPLRYADDDAARYFDLFRSLGFRTYLLTRADENTRRLHAQAVAESHPPREAELRRVIDQLAADIARARRQRVTTVLYVVYAGHGNVREGSGYVTLEDGRLDSKRIRTELLDRLQADRAHVIVDACNSLYLAHSRGPGGTRRPLHGFSQLGGLLAERKVGLLLSSSAAQETHEWEALQAGVFSHEVRSGLYGAADADGDGLVSYREIAAFVSRANAAIPNERYRPRVFARAPVGVSTLIDLRRHRARFLRVGGSQAGRYLLEDRHGVRLADFHSSAGQTVTLLRPQSAGVLYLRRLNDEREYRVPSSPGELALASLEPQRLRSSARGAAHHAFRTLFSLPFDKEVVSAFDISGDARLFEGATNREDVERSRLPRWRRYVGWSALGVGTAALASGIALSVRAHRLSEAAQPGDSQSDVAERNDRIKTHNIAAGTLYGVAAISVAGALTALLWPRRAGARPPQSAASLTLSFDGTTLSALGTF